MADQPYESGGEERIWDEYDWERFLQQQDRKTEKYMELLEKYLDDPNRDQIIAREMGWHHLLDENGKDWSEDLDVLFTQQQAGAPKKPGEEGAESDDNEEETISTRTKMPLTKRTKMLSTTMNWMMTRRRRKKTKKPKISTDSIPSTRRPAR